MACIYISPEMQARLAPIFARWAGRRNCKVRVTRQSHDEFLVEQGNERLGYTTHGALVRVDHRWNVQTGEDDLNMRINGTDGFARRCDAKHALLWFWKEGTTYRDGKIIPWVDKRV